MSSDTWATSLRFRSAEFQVHKQQKPTEQHKREHQKDREVPFVESPLSVDGPVIAFRGAGLCHGGLIWPENGEVMSRQLMRVHGSWQRATL